MSPTQFGIDGCKAGWLAIQITGDKYIFEVSKSLNGLIQKHSNCDRYLIDIPIGLGSKSRPRTIDHAMRKELPKRTSTVFNTPCRKAIYSSNYELAKKANITVEGKSLSQQSFAICPKIREVDEFITAKSNIDLIESHPEVAFKYLNNRTVIQSKKKSPEVILERLNILSRYNNIVYKVYVEILSKTLRKHVAKDDIIDALCLAVTLETAGRSLHYIEDSNKFDEKNIPIRIGVYSSQTSPLSVPQSLSQKRK